MNSGNSAQSVQLKPYLTYLDQLALLKQRGMLVNDEPEAVSALQRLNYYRLSGYWYPFRKTNPIGQPGRQSDFVKDTTFELIVALYEFDRHLRLLVLDAIERIEVALRVDIAHRLGAKNPLAHEMPNHLDGMFSTRLNPKTGRTGFDDWQLEFTKVVSDSKDEFVNHHKRHYQSKMPIWVAVEILGLGQLSRLYAGMQSSDRNYVARRYGLPPGNILESWLRNLTLVRNISAHHGRLWNRNIANHPSFPPTMPHHYLHHVANSNISKGRIYESLCIIRTILKVVAPNSDWAQRLKSTCLSFPPTTVVSLVDAGFPNGWESLSLWR